MHCVTQPLARSHGLACMRAILGVCWSQHTCAATTGTQLPLSVPIRVVSPRLMPTRVDRTRAPLNSRQGRRDTRDPCALIATVPRHSSSLAAAWALAVHAVEDAQHLVTFRTFLLLQRLGLDLTCLRLARRVFGSFHTVFQGNQLCPQTCNGCFVLDDLFPCFSSFLVACSVARSAWVLPPLAIAFSTASGNTSFNAVRTNSCNPGASCVITVPVSIAIGLARPGLPSTRHLEGES